MEFDKVIRDRLSVRKFSDEKVGSEELNKILEAGRLAPTAKNIQPIKIYVLTDVERLDKATRCRYGASTCLLICGNRDTAYDDGVHSTVEIDASICATHMMLECTNVGVDSVWVELFDRDIIKSEFDIPDNIVPVCLLPIGYRTLDYVESINHSKRKDIEEIVEYK